MRKTFLSRFAVLVFCMVVVQGTGLLFQSSRADAAQPNIILISADNLGVGDLCANDPKNPNFQSSRNKSPYTQANTSLCYTDPITKNYISKTPTLDGLAAAGVTLTNYYTPVPICAPSRAALMTGQDPRRYQVYSALADEHSLFVPGSAVTIADVLNKAGYSTAIVGKWHLGWDDDIFCPSSNLSGKGCNSWEMDTSKKEYRFEYNYVLPLGIGQNHKGFCLAKTSRYLDRTATVSWSYIKGILDSPFGSYGVDQYMFKDSDDIDPKQWISMSACSAATDIKSIIDPNAPSNGFLGVDKSLTQVLTDRANGYIKNIDIDNLNTGVRDATKPFFLYLAYPAPHAPLYVHLKQTKQTPKLTTNLIKISCKDRLDCTPKEFHDSCFNSCGGNSNSDVINCVRNCELDFLYPYVIDELDKNIGQILNTLHETCISANNSLVTCTFDSSGLPLNGQPLENNTIVIFTSDNGPYMGEHNEYWNLRSGSAGGLRGGQKINYEGGVRVPFIAWWPGHWPSSDSTINTTKINAGDKLSNPADMMDILPTLAKEAGGAYNKDTNTFTFENANSIMTKGKLDGLDISDIMKGKSTSQPKDIQSYWYYADVYDNLCVDWVDTSKLNSWLTKGYCKSGSNTGNNHPVAARSTDLSNIKLFLNNDACIIKHGSTCVPAPATPTKLFDLSTASGGNESPEANLCREIPETLSGINYCEACCVSDTKKCFSTGSPEVPKCVPSETSPSKVLWNGTYKTVVETLWQKAYTYSVNVAP